MKPTKLFFFLFFLLLTTAATAQYGKKTWYQEYYPSQDHGASSSMCKAVDGSGFVFAQEMPVCRIVRINEFGDLLWDKQYDEFMGITSIQEAHNSCYIIGGYDSSYASRIAKLNAAGDILWEKKYHIDTTAFNIRSVEKTIDGGYIIGASMIADACLLKLDDTGGIVWEQTYGGTSLEYFHTAHQTADGGYIFVSGSSSNNGDVTDHIGSVDYWVAKTNPLGNISWARSYGGTNADYPSDLVETTHGDFLVIGKSLSDDIDVNSHIAGDDIWLVKLDNSGDIIWERSFGSSHDDWGGKIKETPQGNYLIMGEAYNPSNNSFPGLPCKSNTISAFGAGWVANIDTSGAFNWTRQFFGRPNCLESVDGNGAIIVGASPFMYNTDRVCFAARFDDTTTFPGCDSTIMAMSVNNSPAMSEQVVVYPTITNGVVHVDIPNADIDANIELFDLVGKKVNVGIQKYAANKYEININNIPPAMYILTVTGDNNRQVFKIIYEP